MRIRIIEPEGEFFNEEGTFLEFTTINGRVGVYEDHIPLTTILEPCMVKPTPSLRIPEVQTIHT